MWVRLEGKLYNLDRVTKIEIVDNELRLDGKRAMTANLTVLVDLLADINESLGVKITARSKERTKEDKIQTF